MRLNFIRTRIRTGARFLSDIYSSRPKGASNSVHREHFFYGPAPDMMSQQLSIHASHPGSSLVHIIRHGQSLHNVIRGYPHRDPPLTEAGQVATKNIYFPVTPDLIIMSPMTRAIQTAMNAFPSIFEGETHPNVQIWPDLREAYDFECNKGLSRADISAKFPALDFAQCPEIWDTYPLHTIAGAVTRAERVRSRLRELSIQYQNIALVTHRGFIAFLVKGARYDFCETRSYRWATEEETNNSSVRMVINVDTEEMQDFGPALLIEVARNR